MINDYVGKLFSKENRMSTIRGIILVVCSVLYVLCDDHTDKIITAVMSILALDNFARAK